VTVFLLWRSDESGFVKLESVREQLATAQEHARLASLNLDNRPPLEAWRQESDRYWTTCPVGADERVTPHWSVSSRRVLP
jgi:hypothetical protein